MDDPRVLVTDLDNTLFYPGTETVPDPFFSLIADWRQRGGTWIIATGRPVHPLHEFCEEWGTCPDFYVARERFIIRRDEQGWSPLLDWNRRMARRTRRVESPPHDWLDRLRDRISHDRVEMDHQHGHCRFEDTDEAARAEQIVEKWLPGDRTVIRNRVHLGVVPRRIGKGLCLNRLIRPREWTANEVVAIGDSANDRGMLDGRYGFRSVAVDNAEEEIKELVRENDGLVMDREGGEAVVRLLERLLESR